MNFPKIPKFLKKFKHFYFMLGILGIVLITGILLILFRQNGLIKQKAQPTPDNRPGLAFSRFWQQIPQTSQQFLQGKELYIAVVDVVNVANFSKIGGKAGIWQATIVRCEQFFTKPSIEGTNQLNCLGQSANAVMADPQLTGLSDELTLEVNEIPFSGLVVKANEIIIGVEEAESIANQFYNYNYQGNEDYNYKLIIDKRTAIPYWYVNKRCSAAALRQDSCDENNDWSLMVSAITGETL